MDDDLTTVWLNAADQKAVTRASHEMERHLAEHPRAFGESRGREAERVGFQFPLGVYFEIVEDDKKVIVRHVFAAG